MLLDAGNPLAEVSRWIGHASVDMTQHYWERGRDTALQLPWLQTTTGGDHHHPPAEEAEEAVRLLMEHNRMLRDRLLGAVPLVAEEGPGAGHGGSRQLYAYSGIDPSPFVLRHLGGQGHRTAVHHQVQDLPAGQGEAELRERAAGS